MDLKGKLVGIGTKILENMEGNTTIVADPTKEIINLDDKVDEFINWYYINMVKGHYTDIGEYQFPRAMRNLIEKIAVWYELRYPSYEVNRLMPGSGQEEINVSEVMFNNNPYVIEVLDKKINEMRLSWDNFYNTGVFINSLPWEERCYFDSPKYSRMVYLDTDSRIGQLYLTKYYGYVEAAINVTSYTNSVVKDEELVGLNIRDVIKTFQEKGIKLPKNNELEMVIKKADKWIQQKEGILDCAMYRIIERGGNRIGPRRAFLFAKEFDRDINIPIMYAVDFSDPGLRLFMNEFIKAGGNKDLRCYVDYFSRASSTEKMDTITVQELIFTKKNDVSSFYTSQDEELSQRTNDSTNQDDCETKRQEVIKQLRF